MALFLIGLTFAGGAHAATISVSGAPAGEPGMEVDVPIYIDNAAGVLGYSFQLTYASLLLEYVATYPGSLTASWSLVANGAVPGSVIVAGLNTTALSGSGTLALIRLRVKNTATLGQNSALQLINATLNDGAIVATPSNGQLSVENVVIASLPTNLIVTSGEEIRIPIEVDDATGVLGFTFSLTFDPALFEGVGADNGSLTTGWSLISNAQGDRVTVAGLSTTALSGGGTLVEVILLAKAVIGSQQGMLGIVDAELNDGVIALASVPSVSVSVDPPDDPLPPIPPGVPLHAAPALAAVLALLAARKIRASKA